MQQLHSKGHGEDNHGLSMTKRAIDCAELADEVHEDAADQLHEEAAASSNTPPRSNR